MNIDKLEADFGVDFWKVKEVFKIYMTMSQFLPEVYYAAIIDRNLVAYLTYFE